MFLALGLKNAWRNRGRTALGIISMAVAAIIFMSSSTLSKGYPSRALWEARQLAGGEILLLPEKVTLSTDTLSSGGYTWSFEKTSYDKPTAVMGFDPTPYRYGMMRGVPAEGGDEQVLSRIDDVVAELRAEDFVSGVMVREALPFLVEARQEDLTFYSYGFVEPRDVASDVGRYEMDQAVTHGRYLVEDDFMKGVACLGWQYLSVGGASSLQFPTMSEIGYDYENGFSQGLEIVGGVSFRTPNPAFPPYSNPVVFVTPRTFESLKEATGIPSSSTTWGISVSVKSMAELESYVALLRRLYPDFTVYGVSQLATAASVRESVGTGVPMDMRRVTEVLSVMIAALLSATNLSILMLARKNEIGILRALGATRWNIACMVLAESLWIALLGSLAGSLFTQPAIIYQLTSNKIPSGAVVSTIAVNVGKSLGFSLCAAVLFGFLPVAKALRVTPAQVMRGE
jgi:hypothetical protein